MTLNQILFVGLLTAISLVAMALVPYLIEKAPSWIEALGARYLQPRPAEPVRSRPERPNAGTPHSNAAERGSGGSDRSVNPRNLADPEPEPLPNVAMVRAIAAHKLTHPSDGKEATILQAFGARKGSSKAYVAASAAWDWLYTVEPAPNELTPIAGRPYDPSRYPAERRPALAEE